MQNESNNIKLAAKVENITHLLTKLSLQIDSLSQPSPTTGNPTRRGNANPTPRRNTTTPAYAAHATLQRYLSSANDALSSAASVISSRGESLPSGSVIEPLLPAHKREQIGKWLLDPVIEEREIHTPRTRHTTPLHSAPGSESEDAATEYTRYDARGRVEFFDDNETRLSSLDDGVPEEYGSGKGGGGGKFDLENTVLENLLRTAGTKFGAQEYKEARDLYQRFQVKSLEKYSPGILSSGTSVPGGTPPVILFSQVGGTGAAGVTGGAGAGGKGTQAGTAYPHRDETLERLSICYIHLWDWHSVDHILCTEQFQARDKVLEMLLGRYLHHRLFTQARDLILRERDQPPVDGPHGHTPPVYGLPPSLSKRKEIMLSRVMAETCLALGDYELAKVECRRAAMERVVLGGKDDVVYHMCIAVLAEIYEAQGDLTEGVIYRDMVPEGIDGTPTACCVAFFCLSLRAKRLFCWVLRAFFVGYSGLTCRLH